jgi:chromosome segregation ATPase
MPTADAKAAPEPATANVENFAAALFSVPQAKPLLKSEKTPPPAATATADDSLTNERLSAKIVALEKEMKDIRSQIQERPQTKEGPTAAQYERLQQELRDQKSEMKDMRSQMDAMQRQLKEMSLRFDQTPSPNKSPQVHPSNIFKTFSPEFTCSTQR